MTFTLAQMATSNHRKTWESDIATWMTMEGLFMVLLTTICGRLREPLSTVQTLEMLPTKMHGLKAIEAR